MQPGFDLEIGQTLGLNLARVFQDQRALNHIAQLTNISRPMVA